ncbi:MAG: hypothetical protein AAB791_01330 [Patescibacteria group bacterium]
MDDDQKLKVILYIILALSVVIIIGIWEKALEPLIAWIWSNVKID